MSLISVTHPDLQIRGGGGPQKNFFRSIGPHFDLKIKNKRGAWAPAVDLPLLSPNINFSLVYGFHASFSLVTEFCHPSERESKLKKVVPCVFFTSPVN